MAITRTTFDKNNTNVQYQGSTSKFLIDGDFINVSSWQVSQGYGFDFTQTLENKIAKLKLYTNCASGTTKYTWYNDGSTWLSVTATADSEGVFNIVIPATNTPPNVVAVRSSQQREIWFALEVEYSDGEIENNFKNLTFRGNKVGTPKEYIQNIVYVEDSSNYLTISGDDFDWGLTTDGDVGTLYFPRVSAYVTNTNNQPIIGPDEVVDSSNNETIPVFQIGNGGYVYLSMSSNGTTWDVAPSFNYQTVPQYNAKYFKIDVTRNSSTSYSYKTSYSTDGSAWSVASSNTSSTNSPVNPSGLIGIGCAHYTSDLVQYAHGYYIDPTTFRYEKNGTEVWVACAEPSPEPADGILYIGNHPVAKVYKGPTRISRICFGSKLVYLGILGEGDLPIRLNRSRNKLIFPKGSYTSLESVSYWDSTQQTYVEGIATVTYSNETELPLGSLTSNTTSSYILYGSAGVRETSPYDYYPVSATGADFIMASGSSTFNTVRHNSGQFGTTYYYGNSILGYSSTAGTSTYTCTGVKVKLKPSDSDAPYVSDSYNAGLPNALNVKYLSWDYKLNNDWHISTSTNTLQGLQSAVLKLYGSDDTLKGSWNSYSLTIQPSSANAQYYVANFGGSYSNADKEYIWQVGDYLILELTWDAVTMPTAGHDFSGNSAGMSVSIGGYNWMAERINPTAQVRKVGFSITQSGVQLQQDYNEAWDLGYITTSTTEKNKAASYSETLPE